MSEMIPDRSVEATSLQVCISQPEGTSLTLSLTDSRDLHVSLEGGGLSARGQVMLNRVELCKFFSDAATGRAPKWERWEYKWDENFILHAAPAFPAGPEEICLWIDLVSTADDNTSWQVNETIVLPVSRFREYATEVARVFA